MFERIGRLFGATLLLAALAGEAAELPPIITNCEIRVNAKLSGRKAFYYCDDVIWLFRDLARQRPKSLFDNPFLKLMKEAHDRYGFKVQLNCFYRTDFFYGTDEFTLAEMPDVYKPEWQANRDWLRLGFHSLQEFPDYPFINADYRDMKRVLDLIGGEIRRFAGEGVFAKGAVVHWGTCSRDACRALRDAGFGIVLASCGPRKPYGGDPSVLPYGHAMRLEQNRKPESCLYTRISENDAIASSIGGYNNLTYAQAKATYGTFKYVYDREVGIGFKEMEDLQPLAAGINLYTMKNLVPTMEKYAGNEFFVYGNHEQYFYRDYLAYQPDYGAKVLAAAKFLKERGYTYFFLEELAKTCADEAAIPRRLREAEPLANVSRQAANPYEPHKDVTLPGRTPVGFREQCARPRWVTYRSFNKELERTGQFGAMGITNRCFFAANTINHGGSPYCEYPLIWKGFGSYDWSALDAQAGDLVRASPNARFMVMIDLNTPYWATHGFWLDSFTDITHAASDPKWRERTEKWMLDFIAYAERRWGDRIGAYILSGGGTSEWYEYDRGRTSANKDAAWVRWCKARGLDFGTSVPPRPRLATAAFENLVYDPKTEPEKIAYWKFHNSLAPDALLGFAKKARAAIPKKKEIGAFFGYFLVSDDKHTSFGHLDYERVYASPDIDFLIAPGSYSARPIGGGSGSQLVDGTALRYGKRFLHEIDFWPHTKNDVWKTLADDLAGNTREAAFAISKNASYWWFDMWGGFYDDPAVRARIAAIKRAQELVPDAPSVSQILLVADPESIYYLNERNAGERAFGQAMRNELAKTGAPYDTCSFGDLDAIDLSPYRLVILNSTLLVTPAREKLLRAKVFTQGRTVLWTYAPGLIDGASLDPARVAKFAGVPYKTAGVSETAMPGGWRAVYAHDYKLYTAEKLAEIESRAGVHRYVGLCTPVFAKEGYLAIHTKDGGDLEVRLPRKAARVTDLLTGETLATEADRFATRFATPDTRLFRIE